MKVLRLIAERFKPFDKIELPSGDFAQSLPEGLFVVEGLNSSGKTSLIEAILWALWGTLAVPVEKQDQLVKKKHSECKVTLEFEVGGEEYQVIRRYMRGKTGADAVLSRRSGDKFVVMEEGSGRVESKLEELMGISRENALHTVFIRQGEVDSLATAPPTLLRSIISTLFNLDELDQIHSDILLQDEKALEREIHEIERETAKLPDKERDKERLEEKISELEEHKKRLEKSQREIEVELKRIPEKDTISSIKELLDNVAQAEKELGHLEEKIRRSTDEKAEHEKELRTLQENKEKAEADLRRATEKLGNIPTLDKIKEINRHHEKIVELQSQIKELVKDENLALNFKPEEHPHRVKDETPTVEKQLQEREAQLEEVEKELEKLKDNMALLKAEVKFKELSAERLEKEGECPSCLRPVVSDDERKYILSRLEKRLKGIEQTVAEMSEKKVRSDKKLKDLNKECKALRDLFSIFRRLEGICNRLIKENNSFTHKLGSIGFPSLEKFLETYQIQNIDELISVRALLESEIKRLEGDLKEIPKKIGKEQKAIEKAATEIKGDLGKRNKLIRAKKEATSKLDNILADLKYASVEVILKDFAVDSLESLRDLRIALERDYQNNAERVKELKAEVKKQMEELKYLKETISQLNQKEKEKKKKEERLKHVRYLRTTVGGFISEYIIQTRLFSALKDATNNYLFAFTTGRYQVQEIYSTSHVVRGGRETIGVDLTLNDLMDGFQKFRGNLSGGDKVALGLALRMAISRLMARVRPFKTEKLRAPIINCLIMDEPLASLDYMRRPSVMNSLIQDQSFRQIFLITHTQLEGIDASKVHRILVKSEGGNSNITFTPAITLNQAN